MVFSTGIGASGAHQLLFYAEIDETMRIDEDDGIRNGHTQKVRRICWKKCMKRLHEKRIKVG